MLNPTHPTNPPTPQTPANPENLKPLEPLENLEPLEFLENLEFLATPSHHPLPRPPLHSEWEKKSRWLFDSEAPESPSLSESATGEQNGRNDRPGWGKTASGCL